MILLLAHSSANLHLQAYLHTGLFILPFSFHACLPHPLLSKLSYLPKYREGAGRPICLPTYLPKHRLRYLLTYLPHDSLCHL